MAWESYRVGYVNRINTPANSTVFCSLRPTDTNFGKIFPTHLAVQNGRGPERISVIIDGITYECGQYSNVAYPISDGFEAVIINGNNPDVEVFLLDEKHAAAYLARYTSFPAPLDPAQTGLIRPEITITMTVCDNGFGGTGEIIVGNSNDVAQDATVTVGTDQQNQTIVANGIHTFTFTGLGAGTHAVNVVFSSGVSSSGMLVITSCQVPESKPLWVWDATSPIASSIKIRDGFPPIVGDSTSGATSAINYTSPTGTLVPSYLTTVAELVAAGNSGTDRATVAMQIPTSWNFSLKFWVRRLRSGNVVSERAIALVGVSSSVSSFGVISMTSIATMRGRANWILIQRIFPNNTTDIILTGDSSSPIITTSASLTDWYHIGLYTRQAPSLEVWVNGAFGGIIDVNPNLGFIFFSSAVGTTDKCDLQLGDVRFYDSVLPDSARGVTTSYYNF